ncbi:MAG: cobyrinate a,c-diamide synthase [Sedimenticola sp.]
MSHFFISAAHKSSGKTTVSIGLTAALRERGMAVQPFKKGPDYIDPIWLSAAGGNNCINLDFYTMSAEEITQEFHRAMMGKDIGVIEGNKGLYDGLDLDGSNSNAALATQLNSPVFLVIDARGMTRGIAPLILGYQAFDQNLTIAGVILNKVGGSRHEGKLCRVIEHYTDIPVVGSVHSNPELEIDERHLGLMPSNESSEAAAKIRLLGQRVAEQVDLDRILEFAAATAPLPEVTEEKYLFTGERVRIGYPRDRAFGFYYPGDLTRMEKAGAELVPFDALSDSVLPPVDGLFIGGGFPEIAMDELEANNSLRQEIKAFVEAGGPVYAECGGLMYLARKLTWQDKVCKMVGAIPGDIVMHERPQGRGYVRLREREQSPWPKLPGQSSEIAAHEFHYSAIENLDKGINFAYQVIRGTGIDGSNDGIVYKNLLASYTHMRDVGGNHWTQRFVEHVRACKPQVV